mmetsp:Transcript_14704/g.32004  ORF Transcript_14704/g.32004 Transcript_14704/m.32004 type:complete len:289 (+) Transcript_14704:1849-2715(+)
MLLRTGEPRHVHGRLRQVSLVVPRRVRRHDEGHGPGPLVLRRLHAPHGGAGPGQGVRRPREQGRRLQGPREEGSQPRPATIPPELSPEDGPVLVVPPGGQGQGVPDRHVGEGHHVGEERRRVGQGEEGRVRPGVGPVARHRPVVPPDPGGEPPLEVRPHRRREPAHHVLPRRVVGAVQLVPPTPRRAAQAHGGQDRLPPQALAEGVPTGRERRPGADGAAVREEGRVALLPRRGHLGEGGGREPRGGLRPAVAEHRRGVPRSVAGTDGRQGQERSKEGCQDIQGYFAV